MPVHDGAHGDARVLERGSGFRGAPSNPWLWAALAITFALELCALAIPPLRELLGLTTVRARGYVVAIGLGLLPLAVVQVARRLRS